MGGSGRLTAQPDECEGARPITMAHGGTKNPGRSRGPGRSDPQAKAAHGSGAGEHGVMALAKTFPVPPSVALAQAAKHRPEERLPGRNANTFAPESIRDKLDLADQIGISCGQVVFRQVVFRQVVFRQVVLREREAADPQALLHGRKLHGRSAERDACDKISVSLGGSHPSQQLICKPCTILWSLHQADLLQRGFIDNAFIDITSFTS
jgi:hypothetical protein